MTEKTKWEIIAERKRLKKEEAAIRAGGGIDRSWQRFTYCRICNQKICVNNYADHKVRLPKVKGIIMCPWCKSHGGELIARLYRLGEIIAAGSEESVDAQRARKIMAKSPEQRRKRDKAKAQAAQQG